MKYTKTVQYMHDAEDDIQHSFKKMPNSKKYSPTLTFSVNIGLGKEEQQVSIYEGKRQAQTD